MSFLIERLSDVNTQQWVEDALKKTSFEFTQTVWRPACILVGGSSVVVPSTTYFYPFDNGQQIAWVEDPSASVLDKLYVGTITLTLYAASWTDGKFTAGIAPCLANGLGLAFAAGGQFSHDFSQPLVGTAGNAVARSASFTLDFVMFTHLFLESFVYDNFAVPGVTNFSFASTFYGWQVDLI